MKLTLAISLLLLSELSGRSQSKHELETDSLITTYFAQLKPKKKTLYLKIDSSVFVSENSWNNDNIIKYREVSEIEFKKKRSAWTVLAIGCKNPRKSTVYTSEICADLVEYKRTPKPKKTNLISHETFRFWLQTDSTNVILLPGIDNNPSRSGRELFILK